MGWIVCWKVGKLSRGGQAADEAGNREWICVWGGGGGGVFVEDSLSCLVSRGVKVQVAGDKS